MVSDMDVEWIEFANCKGVDPNLFFGHKGASLKTAKAFKYCEACAVREVCLSEAMNDPHLRAYGEAPPMSHARGGVA